MKFLLVLSWLELGGAERQAINFADYLLAHGHKVTVLGLGVNGQVNDICRSKGIQCVSIPPRNDLYTIYYKIRHKLHINPLTDEEIALYGLIHSLSNYINREEYDVAISYCALANTVLGCAKSRIRHTVCIWYQRDGGVYDKTEGLQPQAVKGMDLFLANGMAGVISLRQKYGVEARLIYNGVNVVPSLTDRAGWRDRLNVSDSDVVCTMVAQLTHDSKDHMTLLKAWKRLLSIDNRFYLVLAGRFANAYEELTEYVEAEDLGENIRFLGHIDDVYGVLRASDICVFSSKTEGSPNGVIEGCMCSLPVVATDAPEIREILSEENYPFLFQIGDDDQAAEHIMHLAEDEDLRLMIGDLNKGKSTNMFDPNTNFAKLVQVSQGLVLKKQDV